MALTAGILNAGCFSSVALVKVRADGSGTIELTTTLRKAALATFDEAVGDPAYRPSRAVEDWFPESAAMVAGAGMGTDVRLVSTRPLDMPDVIGRVSTYHFHDVRRLTLEMIPILPHGGTHGSTARLVGRSHFTFGFFDEADRSVLVARFPDAQIEHSGPDADGRTAPHDARQEALIRAFVGGGGVEIAIEPELPILQTNTPHRRGQRVTLLAIDAERVVLDADSLTRLRLRPASLDELRFELHDAPGVTVGLDQEIRIELGRR